MAPSGPREVAEGTALNEFLTSAGLIDFVIVLTVLEGLTLAVYRRFRGRGLGAGDYALNLLAGLCLMLALRCAVRDAGWPWLGMCLFAAGLAHAADLRLRWHHRSRTHPTNPTKSP